MKTKKVIKKIIETTGYTVVNKKYLYPPDIYGDKDFMEVYEKCKPYTMVSIERSFALYNAIKYISRNKIPGDLVECGVWRGGQSMLMAYALLQEEDIERNIWLYDTYEGMSKPTNVDKKAGDDKNVIERWEKENRVDYSEWCYASLEEVKRNIFSTKYPKENIKFIKGKVEDTIPKTMPESISVLRLDTDFYESTKHELKHIYPKLEKGGVLLIDDYGSYVGSRKAVDEYFNNTAIMLNRVGSGRIGVRVFQK